MKYVVYGTIGEWRESPFVYDSIEDAVSFFDELHPAYYDHYNIVEFSIDEIHEIYTYHDFVRKYVNHMITNEEPV